MSSVALNGVHALDPARVSLRYAPRAGLLPELSRQTYDAFYKALREAILNGLDAEATRVEIDFSEAISASRLTVRDNGCGMSLDEFRASFLALGGSDKYARADRFGRIGIGSLALLHYAAETVIRTKPAGSDRLTVAYLADAWSLDAADRRRLLSDFDAGSAEEIPYDGDPSDHFTEIELRGLRTQATRECVDTGSFFRLVDRLRRVLPLPWSDGPLLDSLRQHDSEVAAVLAEHIAGASGTVEIRSAWGDSFALTHRAYGDDGVPGEAWTARPWPFVHKTWVREHGARRRITLIGYLLSQERATPAWSGVTARVQNVAVEERTFFDLEADPGFRKYITGELFVAGDVDTTRLINIDRASFNRESPDYSTIQRFMTQAITDFKSRWVQGTQRQKVQVRRVVERHRTNIEATQAVLAAAESHAAADCRGLPASRNGRFRSPAERDLAAQLAQIGAHVTRSQGAPAIRVTDANEIAVGVDDEMLAPEVNFRGTTYRLRLVEARESDPPVMVRNRPRELVVNLANPHVNPDRIEVAVALEVAYLVNDDGDAESLYDVLLPLLAAPAR
jgi:hypothetical protein